MSYNKFGNKKGSGFDSKKERLRYAELQLLERAGKIQGLTRQVRFELIPAQYDSKGKCIERSCSYIADFTYWENDRFVVEDCKGFRTKEYVIKRKLMLNNLKIRIRET